MYTNVEAFYNFKFGLYFIIYYPHILQFYIQGLYYKLQIIVVTYENLPSVYTNEIV